MAVRMIETPATRVCVGCRIEKDFGEFDRMRENIRSWHTRCRPCQRIRDNAIQRERRARLALVQHSPRITPHAIEPATVFDRLAVILACWDDCVEEGALAIARMLNLVYEVVEQLDPERARQMRRIVAQVRVGEMALGEARRALEASG